VERTPVLVSVLALECVAEPRDRFLSFSMSAEVAVVVAAAHGVVQNTFSCAPSLRLPLAAAASLAAAMHPNSTLNSTGALPSFFASIVAMHRPRARFSSRSFLAAAESRSS